MEPTASASQFWRTVEEMRLQIRHESRGDLALSLAYMKANGLLRAGEVPINAIQRIEDEDVRAFVWESVTRASDSLDAVAGASVQIAAALPDDEGALAEILLDVPTSAWSRSFEETPAPVARLAAGILQIGGEDEVADLGVGGGNFLVEAARTGAGRLFYGCDIETRAIGVARLRTSALKADVTIEQADMFRGDAQYDKCFSNYPLNMRGEGFREEKLAEMGVDGRSLPKFASNDWLFNLLLTRRTRHGGRAVGIMASGAGWNMADREIRRWFVGRGLIEAIIELPKGIFPYMSISTVMVVLSEGNEAVRMVDASTICERGRRMTTLSDENIRQIVALYLDGGEGSALVDPGRLAENDYVLTPARYVGGDIVVEGGVALGDVCRNITRGASTRAAELEERHSAEPTPFRYLMLQNIADGRVDDDLPYLTGVDPREERYCAKDGDIVLSKIGPNFKAAVVDVAEGERVLCTGNLYILSVDRSRFEPRYVQMCLESETGQAQLNAVSVGTVMRSVSVRDLRGIQVPGRPLEEQRGLVGRYEELQELVDYHRHAIERARQQMASLLDEG